MDRSSPLPRWWRWCGLGCSVPSDLIGCAFVTTDLAGVSASLPIWCAVHTRFDLSQADFEERWCLGGVLARAHVPMDAAGLAALCVHVPLMPDT
jgi:hypothetical protein